MHLILASNVLFGFRPFLGTTNPLVLNWADNAEKEVNASDFDKECPFFIQTVPWYNQAICPNLGGSSLKISSLPHVDIFIH